MPKIKLLSIFFLLYTTAIFGSSLKHPQWNILTSYDKNETINTTYNKKKRISITTFKGSGTRSAYILDLSKTEQPKKKLLQWKMKYSEDFVILIDLNSSFGRRTLIYTPRFGNDYLQFGLGEDAISKKWKEHIRNLDNDLKLYEPNNNILSINNFIIRGSGSISNLKFLNNKEIKKIIKKKNIDKKNKINPLPSITIKGKNPYLLHYGERYIEAGATAKDIDGSPLKITISENIDFSIPGEYTVLYMTTNSLGNSAIDKRTVRIIADKSNNTNRDKSPKRDKSSLITTDMLQKGIEKKSLNKELFQPKRDTKLPERPGL